MKQITYVTGNDVKLRQATVDCKPFGIEFMQAKLDIVEIQSDDGASIAQDKAIKAFDALQKPLIVSDDVWMIPGLKGFPGPYMKYMNDWFTTEDWLRLTSTLQDRRIILRQTIVYIDASQQQLFSAEYTGELMTEVHGHSDYPGISIVSFDGGKHSYAEYHERGESIVPSSESVWNSFAEWYGKLET